MASSVTINFDDDDDDDEGIDPLEGQEYNENDQGDTSFDPSTFGDSDSNATEPDILVQPKDFQETTPDVPIVDPSKKVDVDALVDAELRKQAITNRRLLNEEKAEQRRLLREQQEDAARQQRRDRKDAKAASQEQKTNIRSEAISQRVQAYAASSVLGLPGYIGASFVDQFIIRKNEDLQIQAQKEYEANLERYNQQVEIDRVQERRDAEAKIRELPVQAVDVDAVRAKHGLPPLPPADNSGKQPDFVGPMKEPEGPPRPPAPPGGPPAAASDDGGKRPPPVLPTMPNIPTTNAGMGVGIATAAFMVAQQANQVISSTGDQIQRLGEATLGDDPFKAAKEGARTFQKTADPLGVGIPLEVAVTGFEVLLGLTEQIMKNSEKDLAFSPLSLTANVEGTLQKLLQQIDIAERLDPLKSEVIRARTEVDMAWQEFKARAFEDLAPTIILILKLIASGLDKAAAVQKVTGGALDGFFATFSPATRAILQTLGAIKANTTPAGAGAALDKSGILGEIRDFMDPTNMKDIPKAAFPNGVP